MCSHVTIVVWPDNNRDSFFAYLERRRGGVATDASHWSIARTRRSNARGEVGHPLSAWGEVGQTSGAAAARQARTSPRGRARADNTSMNTTQDVLLNSINNDGRMLMLMLMA